jgi:oxygen-independent coproporphyrinogen III oxidase
MLSELVAKYNAPVPRYTSYPAVPYWDKTAPPAETWFREVRDAFTANDRELSLYIHLLFCESLCTYCACNTRITTDHKVEQPYIQRLLKEWAMYLDAIDETPRIRELHLGGGTPTFFSAEHLDHLLDAILSSAQVQPKSSFSFEAHPANTTSSHLEVLARHGFHRMSLGVQDFDISVQRLINRRQSEEQVRAITNLARIIGYNSINFDLVYGLPGQTLISLAATIRKVIDMRPDRIAFYGYAHVPAMRPAQNSYAALLPDLMLRSELYVLGRELLVQAGYVEVGMDHFALPGDELLLAAMSGKLNRNFMGYTDHQSGLLLGIGPSAISDCSTMLMQNVRGLEEWNRAVDRNELPVLKGHMMSAEDLVLRKHIQNIMCKGETNWQADLESCEFLNSVRDRLIPLREDGLIELNAFSLKVTAPGRMFLRNISHCFDAHSWRGQNSVILSAS